MTVLNIFHSGGLWVIPILLFLFALWSIYRGYKSSKSNSTTQVGSGTRGVRIDDNTGNVSIVHTPQFWIGVALIVFGVIAWIWIGADYKGI